MGRDNAASDEREDPLAVYHLHHRSGDMSVLHLGGLQSLPRVVHRCEEGRGDFRRAIHQLDYLVNL